MNWQSIETAPKNGTPIWALGRIYGKPFQFECEWNGVEWYHGFGDGWRELNPSHWMPLPAAPEVWPMHEEPDGSVHAVDPADMAATADFPAGAIHNGRVHAERLEATGLECDAGGLHLCNDWVEFRRCFEYLAQWAEGQAAKESP